MKSAARGDGDLELAGFYDFLLKKVKLVEKRRRDEDEKLWVENGINLLF